jgi:hypothetical protein
MWVTMIASEVQTTVAKPCRIVPQNEHRRVVISTRPLVVSTRMGVQGMLVPVYP